MTDTASIGIKIKEIREKKNLNQGDLAEKTGFNQSKISRLEKGHADLTVSDVLAICDALDVGIEKILSVKDKGYIEIKGEEYQLVERFRDAPEREKQIVNLILNISENTVDDEIIELMNVLKTVDKKHRPMILDSIKKALKLTHEEKIISLENKLNTLDRLTG